MTRLDTGASQKLIYGQPNDRRGITVVEVRSVYFEQIGKVNTEATLALAKARARELGINTIVVATTVGDTGARAVEVFKGMNIVVVSHVHGMREPNKSELTPENRALILAGGATLVTAAHIFGAMGRAVKRKFNTTMFDEIVAQTLRIMGQGIKVVAECSSMAADAGAIRTDEDVIVVSGTGRGADTACVVRAANTQDFFDMKIKEVICKPRLDTPSQAEQGGQAAVPAAAQRPHHS